MYNNACNSLNFICLIFNKRYEIIIIITAEIKVALFLSNRMRITPKLVYYYRCPDHRKNYVMSFAFSFDRESDVYQFAYCYPYSYTRLQNYLDNLEKRNMDYFRRELLCLSVVSIETVVDFIENYDCLLYIYLFVFIKIYDFAVHKVLGVI